MNETCTCYSLKTKLVLPVEDRIERWEEIGSAMVGRPAAGRPCWLRCWGGGSA
jgi:hypothetical protein